MICFRSGSLPPEVQSFCFLFVFLNIELFSNHRRCWSYSSLADFPCRALFCISRLPYWPGSLSSQVLCSFNQFSLAKAPSFTVLCALETRAVLEAEVYSRAPANFADHPQLGLLSPFLPATNFPPASRKSVQAFPRFSQRPFPQRECPVKVLLLPFVGPPPVTNQIPPSLCLFDWQATFQAFPAMCSFSAPFFLPWGRFLSPPPLPRRRRFERFFR